MDVKRITTHRISLPLAKAPGKAPRSASKLELTRELQNLLSLELARFNLKSKNVEWSIEILPELWPEEEGVSYTICAVATWTEEVSDV